MRRNVKYIFKHFSSMLFVIFSLLLISANTLASDIIPKKILFPKAFAIAIDDMGWNEGRSMGDSDGPWRVGLRRDFDLRDYRPIVEVGEAVSVRFQGLFIMAEMDRMNVCAKYPTTTQTGENFDNSVNIDLSQIEVMNYVKENAAYLEFGLHGVGHEHWENGQRTRAEWYDIENDKPWPEQDIRDHIKCFKEIMAQYGWIPENGQSFPESFVPCAYGYYWNPKGSYSTGTIMHENGVKYVNTLFDWISELNPPIEFGGGFDHGVLVINRENYGNEWFEATSLPKEPVENYKTDIIETHWANWLATDDFLQPKLNQKWIDYFKNIQACPDHYLAKNTEQLYSQWLYTHFTTVKETIPGQVTIDNREMPEEAYDYELLGNMVLAISLDEGQHVSAAQINGEPIAAYFEDQGYGYIYIPPLEKRNYQLKYELGNELMPVFINNTGTYNVYSVHIDKEKMEFDLKMYGTQVVRVKSPKPSSIHSTNPNLKILSHQYDSKNQLLLIKIRGRDMQGERGEICLEL